MEDVFEQQHYEYINSEDFFQFMKEMFEYEEKEALSSLLQSLKQEQAQLADRHGKYVPVVLKIAPDLSLEQIHEIADLLMTHKMDGVIASNTTLSRDAVQGLKHADQAGGLSGAPVREKSTWVIRELAQRLQGSLPIIGVGGILSGDDALAKMAAGADLVQLYSGLIYQGPGLVHDVCRKLA